MSATLRKRALLLLVLSLSIFCSCSRDTTHSVSGKVLSIADGDTITILDAEYVQHKIRLKGIDAPERKQDFGTVSREHLANLVFGKDVRIDYDKVDQYGQLVGTVWVDGNNGCLEQLKAGLAWHYKEYEKEQPAADRQLYANAEQKARTEKRGLWKDPSPTPPWEFRDYANGPAGNTVSPDEQNSDDRNIKTSSSPVERNQASLPYANHSPANARTLDSNSNRGRVQPNLASAESALICGNRRSMIYHWPGCPNYDDIALHNRVPFNSREEAEEAGYRAARNCH